MLCVGHVGMLDLFCVGQGLIIVVAEGLWLF